METVESYEARKARRLERYRAYAEKARQRSDEQSQRMSGILSNIPMGQPILVGHHSEKRHRRDIERMDNALRKSVEESRKAEHWDKRIDAAESSRRIDNDDPAAVVKLEAKVERLEAYIEEMKRVNREFRKTKSLAEIPMSPGLREASEANLRIYGRQPFPAYVLQNANARLRAAKAREVAIERIQTFEPMSFGPIEVKMHEGYIQIKFPDKPEEAIRQKLRRSPFVFKWSRFQSAWVRKVGPGTSTPWFRDELAKLLQGAK